MTDLIQKWAATGLLDGLPHAEKLSLAELLENQCHQLSGGGHVFSMNGKRSSSVTPKGEQKNVRGVLGN